MTIRVLIADDQGIVRAGLSTILNGQPGIEVAGQAADGRAAVALARRLRPDVCLFDIRMPVLDGIEATRLLVGPEISHPVRRRCDHHVRRQRPGHPTGPAGRRTGRP
jgi:DNA-binding NarL/FixJ family response regulator